MIPLGDHIVCMLCVGRSTSARHVEQQEMCHPSASSSELEVDTANGS